MKISFYMPFKPFGHKNPSGDLITGMELHDFLSKHNHEVEIASTLRSRWLYLKPWKFLNVARERDRVTSAQKSSPADIWLSYHTYYKAPDLLGPACSSRLSIPYVIFQGIYSTKRKRSLKTFPGFLLNRTALQAAQVVFTNKKTDERNLKRLLPEERVKYISPGLIPDQFNFDLVARRALKEQWNVGERRVVMTTAMLRPGVKTTGVIKVIDSCAELRKRGHDLILIVIGDGVNRSMIEQQGREKLSDNILFLGKIPRHELYRYYSAADVFAFPGIEEALGMVYLEAQSAGLPVVAFNNWGAKEAVIHNETGLLSSAERPEAFTQDIESLIVDRDRRIKMRDAAKTHIRTNHDSTINYQAVNTKLLEVVRSFSPVD
jgi:glycosyltransferase involved in cell wall biosynthesis